MQQQEKRITSAQIREKVGLPRPMAEMLRQQRLRWLGHVGRMDESRLPYRMLFGQLPGGLKPGGRKMRWKDKVVRDLKEVGVEQTKWFEMAQDKDVWRSISDTTGKSTTTALTTCSLCGKTGLKGAKGAATHARFCGRAARRMGAGAEVVIEGREGKTPVFKCTKCGLIIKTLQGTRRHETACGVQHGTNRRVAARERELLPATHKCRKCGKKFKQAWHLDQHIKRSQTGCST